MPSKRKSESPKSPEPKKAPESSGNVIGKRGEYLQEKAEKPNDA